MSTKNSSILNLLTWPNVPVAFFAVFFLIWYGHPIRIRDSFFCRLQQWFTNYRTAGEREGGISLAPHYYFHPHHRRLDISQVITAEGSPLHIDSSQTQTKNFWFLSGSCEPLGYTPLNIYILPLQTEKVNVSGY